MTTEVLKKKIDCDNNIWTIKIKECEIGFNYTIYVSKSSEPVAIGWTSIDVDLDFIQNILDFNIKSFGCVVKNTSDEYYLKQSKIDRIAKRIQKSKHPEAVLTIEDYVKSIDTKKEIKEIRKKKEKEIQKYDNMLEMLETNELEAIQPIKPLTPINQPKELPEKKEIKNTRVIKNSSNKYTKCANCGKNSSISLETIYGDQDFCDEKCYFEYINNKYLEQLDNEGIGNLKKKTGNCLIFKKKKPMLLGTSNIITPLFEVNKNKLEKPDGTKNYEYIKICLSYIREKMIKNIDDYSNDLLKSEKNSKVEVGEILKSGNRTYEIAEIIEKCYNNSETIIISSSLPSSTYQFQYYLEKVMAENATQEDWQLIRLSIVRFYDNYWKSFCKMKGS
jgi:hypothetical protein